ncbi:MAG: 30S ribosome-binding factor RbfA [Dissulfuribacterales bacterium]
MAHRFPRAYRIADMIKKELAYLLLGEIKDPRIHGLVTVMNVEVSTDLKYAKIFVAVAGSNQDKKEVLKGFKQAKGFIRTMLAHRIEMRQIPELHFLLDTTLERQLHLEDVLATIPHSSTLAEAIETPPDETSAPNHIENNGK